MSDLSSASESVKKTNADLSVKLKGTLLPVHLLQINTTDLETISKEIQKIVAQAPNFFRNIPVVIDPVFLFKNEISKKEYGSFDWGKIKNILDEHSLIMVGIKTKSEEDNLLWAGKGIALFSVSDPSTEKNEDSNKENSKKSAKNTSLVINSPVRSGQQVYAQGCDLIVLAPVSQGAELLADGNIHVYSSLRGRALAGVMGNNEARIFCHSLEAELLAISGCYMLQDSFQAFYKMSIQLYLENEQLHIAHLQ